MAAAMVWIRPKLRFTIKLLLRRTNLVIQS